MPRVTTDDERISVDDVRRAPQSLGPAAPNDQERLAAQLNEVAGKHEQALDDIRTLKDRNSELMLENGELRSDKSTRELLNGLIESSADSAWRFLYIYCFVALGVLLADALPLNQWTGVDFEVESVVLSVLVGSTAVTVVGLVAIVLSGVFRAPRK